MLRAYQGLSPTIPASCYIDLSAQVIGDVIFGENSSAWMNTGIRLFAFPAQFFLNSLHANPPGPAPAGR